MSTRDDFEEIILTAYRQVAGEDLQADDDFFAAGGDSLGAVDVAAKIQSALGIDVPVALLFIHPTPVELTEALREQPVGSGSEPAL